MKLCLCFKMQQLFYMHDKTFHHRINSDSPPPPHTHHGDSNGQSEYGIKIKNTHRGLLFSCIVVLLVVSSSSSFFFFFICGFV